MTYYFPQGVAIDEAFCNREVEREALKNNIKAHDNIVLVAPRRYGKTSLITQVLKENSFPGVCMDFFFVLKQEEVTKLVNEGVSAIINSLLPKTKKAAEKIFDLIMAHNPRLILNFLGQKLEIRSKQQNEKSISELLLALDQFAGEAGKSCVIVFDEFQQIGELKESHAVEAAIRHAVERSKNVSYIFCGSKRHLLNEMFSNKARPLYHLCDLMTIDRISTSCYQKFLNTLAKKQWGRLLDGDAFNEIMGLTKNHPYYVNALCRYLWKKEKAPVMSNVIKTWDEYVIQQSAWISNDIGALTLNQRKVLMALAKQSVREPQGQEFSIRAGVSPSGIKKIIQALENLDLIYLGENGQYQVLDPAIAYYICEHSL